MTLKVTGKNFPSQAAILWNGAAVKTTVVDANTLSSTIGSSSLAMPGTVELKVQNTQTMQESPAAQVTITDPNAPPPSALTLSIAALPQGVVGASYSGTFSVTGGTAPYTWTLATGQLPPGLSLGTTGTISGTPTSAGNYSFEIRVTDSSSLVQSATTTVSLPVITAPATPTLLGINLSSLPSGTIGSAYSTVLQPSGGTAPYTWSFISGSLPAGLSLNPSTGVISGTPTAVGTASFTVAIGDSSSPAQSKSVTLSIVIAPVSLAITTSALPAGAVGASYATVLQASGGGAPYTWSISSGSLPAGLSLGASTGVISGNPTGNGNFSFGVTVKDAGSPVQTTSATVTLSVVQAGTPLAITTTTLPGGVPNTSYSTTLNATGGTSPYTWSITNGTLPAGLNFTASTATVSGTPTTVGTSSLTLNVADSSSPIQTKSVTLSLAITSASGPGTTWYVRPDGGTRYSANVPSGQCNGKFDASYASTGGTGTNQNCAFNDFRYMWDDESGVVGAGTWVIAGGDTVIIRGCTASANQTNASNPNCRLGWDGPTGPTSGNWCYGVGSYGCYNPPIPAGTASQHTRILGQNYAACNVGGATNPKQYVSNLTQIFGGFGLTFTFNLQDTQYVDVQCIELTTHNGVCTHGGAPSYPRSCNSSQPLDDYAQNGFITNNKTSNVTLQDAYVHGFNASGLYGPIGGPITMTRVFAGFNGFSGWNFADQVDTQNAAGSQILASYVTMIGNGCYEEYPVKHDFPAQACYDSNSGGFGDAWSGQDTSLDVFTCDHCVMEYNTKDAFIGPHTQVGTLAITNSVSIGNMGAQWKWGSTLNANVLLQNNLTVMNCTRMSATLPGAVQNFNQSTGLGGSYLTNYCRAGGDGIAFLTRANSTNHFYGNTIIAANATIMDANCGYVDSGGVHEETNCGTSPLVWTDNNILGYIGPANGGQAPGLWFFDPGAGGSLVLTSSSNNEFGIRNGDTCGTNTITCLDPLLVNEPAQTWPGSEAALDVFDPTATWSSFYPATGSPLIGAGTPISGLTTDYRGVTRPSHPTIGAVEP